VTDKPGWRRRLGVWTAAAAVFLGLMVAHHLTRSRLDDPNSARQRPDVLGANHAPFPAPALAPGIPARGTQAAVFFTRPGMAASLVAALKADPSLARRARLVIVVSGTPAPVRTPAITVVVDPGLAARFHLDRPVDGGPPVGYAVIASSGLVPYETLDPAVADHLVEVQTMVGAAG